MIIICESQYIKIFDPLGYIIIKSKIVNNSALNAIDWSLNSTLNERKIGTVTTNVPIIYTAEFS